MAPPAGQIRPAKYLASFVLIVVALYCLVFFTGNGSAKPKLGIDLQGGTRVTLTARMPDGGQPSDEALNRARGLIENRVNGLGVSGAEVVRDNNNLVITVPGADSEGAKSLGQTARLAFRKVVGQPVPAEASPTQPSASPSSTPPSGSSAPATPSAPASSAAPQGRPAPALQGQPSSSAPPPSTSAPAPSVAPGTDPKLAEEIQAARALRQSTDPQVQQQALVMLDCSKPDPLVGNDELSLPLVACDQKGEFKYVLAPVTPAGPDAKADDFSTYSRLTGEDIDDAIASINPQGAGYVVNLNFKSAGGEKWGKFTSANVNQPVAVVLDGEVVSAPNIQSAILGGNTEISGKFTQKEAENLANVLKYGSLPLSFEASEAETVSATLGLASLKAGLIAGGDRPGAGVRLLHVLLPAARRADDPVAGPVGRDRLRGAGAARPLDRVHPRPRWHRWFHRRDRYHGGLVHRVLRTTEGRGARGPDVPVGRAAGLGPCPSHDPVGRRGQLHRRRGAVRDRGRPGEGLRVHPRHVDGARPRGGVPGDAPAGRDGLEVEVPVQPQAVRPWRGASREGATHRTAIGEGQPPP